MSDRVFGALARFEARLTTRRYLVGDAVTDADILLYVSLVRFDLVAVPLARLNRRRLVDHPNLWAYARDLYQRPAFRDATNWEHLRVGTYRTTLGGNVARIVPDGPVEDWDAPAGREALP